MRGAGFMTQEHCNGCGLGMQWLSGPGCVCQSGAILVLLHHERHILVLVSSCLQVLSGQVKIVSRRWWRESPDWAPHSQLLSHFLMLHHSSFPLQGPADTAERWSRPWPAVSSLNWGNHLSILCTSSDCIAFRRKSNKLFHSTLPHIIYVEIRIAIVTAINQRLVQHDFLIL